MGIARSDESKISEMTGFERLKSWVFYLQYR